MCPACKPAHPPSPAHPLRCDTQLDVTPPAELKESVLAFLKTAKGAIEQATQQPAVSPLAEAQAAELKALLLLTLTPDPDPDPNPHPRSEP